MKYLILFISLCLASSVTFSQTSIEKSFVMISKSPHQFTIKNDHKVNHKGGHLQGIQMIERNGQKIYIVTGSSSTYSYYATIGEVGDNYEVIEVKKLLDKPYKHAGGFQINDGFMVIGIEDNEAKNISKVFVYKANENGAWGTEPFAIIKREGEVKRMTAGCVAIALLENSTLIVVGDWDTKHLDFYLMDEKGSTELAYSLSTQNIKPWNSYQNINLFKKQNGELFLVGLGSSMEEDVAVVYRLEINNWKEVKLDKVAVRNFGSQKKTKFRWGAGVYWDKYGHMKIISCDDDLKNGSMISVYR